MLSIVDYGMGNLRSVEKALESMGYPARLVSTPEQVMVSDQLILPGVGAFGDAMHGLNERGLVQPLREHARRGTPLFGICLGMQILFESSEEDPGVEGLGILSGTVRRFPPSDLKVPHMGWNRLEVSPSSRLLDGLGSDPYVYFVHSYYVCPADPTVVAATADYGAPFAAAVERGMLGGTQFHPEKSQNVGLQILRNFAERMTPAAAIRASTSTGAAQV